jgi:hypothetical protein
MKMVPDALGIAENESGRAKREKGTRRPRYRRKRVRARKTRNRDPTPSVPPKMSLGAQNMTTGPDAHGTPKNMSGSGKHEKGTRRPRYPQKHVRERKIWKLDRTPLIPPKMSPVAQNMKNESRRP